MGRVEEGEEEGKNVGGGSTVKGVGVSGHTADALVNILLISTLASDACSACTRMSHTVCLTSGRKLAPCVRVSLGREEATRYP